MENNSHQSAANAAEVAEAAAGQSAGNPNHHLQQQMEIFWNCQRHEIEKIDDFKDHQLPLARIRKIMKSDEDVRMIAAEVPILFSKACELFIMDLTLRSWLHAEENKRRTLQKNDMAAAITGTDYFDFLTEVVTKEDATGLGPGMVGSTASGVPYYFPPMGHHDPSGVMMPRPTMPRPSVFVHPPPPPSQAAMPSVWKDNSYADGGSSGGQGNLDG